MVGPGPSAGTRAAASELLARNGVPGPFESGDLAASVDALLAGELDAVFLIAGADSPVVRRLLLTEGITPFSFRRAEAYTRTHRFLAHVTLPEGMADYARNLPAALHCAEAVQLAERLPAGAQFDLVVLNSVVQYFPDLTYLLQVIEQASQCLAPGGTLFLGDIRWQPLQAAACASIALTASSDQNLSLIHI